MNRTECREGLRGVADRLRSDCAVDVPLGQVIALVFRVHHALALGPLATPEARLVACEESARRMLANRSSARADRASLEGRTHSAA